MRTSNETRMVKRNYLQTMTRLIQRRNGRTSDVGCGQATLARGMFNGDRRPDPFQVASDVPPFRCTNRLQHGGKTANRRLIETLLEKGHPSNCHYCGMRLHSSQMTLEHLCPTTCQPAKVPNNALSNLAISCAKCNNNTIPLCKRDCMQSNAA